MISMQDLKGRNQNVKFENGTSIGKVEDGGNRVNMGALKNQKQKMSRYSRLAVDETGLENF